MNMCEELYDNIKDISVAVVYDCATEDIIYANSWSTRIEAELDTQVELYKRHHSNEIDYETARGFVLDYKLNSKTLIRISKTHGSDRFVVDTYYHEMPSEFKKNLLDYLEDKIVDSLYDDCD